MTAEDHRRVGETVTEHMVIVICACGRSYQSARNGYGVDLARKRARSSHSRHVRTLPLTGTAGTATMDA